MTKKANYSLVVLWRTEGEQTLNFRDRREAEDHMHLLEGSIGHKIVKMEVVKN